MSASVDTDEPNVPAPVVTVENAGFWQGVNDGEFRLAKCQVCGGADLEDQACVMCGAHERRWEAASDLGSLKSFVVFQRAYNPYWAMQVPYNVCIVSLDDGPDLLTNVADADVDALEIGMRLQIVIRPRGEFHAPVAVPVPRSRAD